MDSSSSTSSAAIDDATDTENRLYKASLILEWQLYGDLLSHHRTALERLQDLSSEAAALREENALLRAANEDIRRRIASRLLNATCSDYLLDRLQSQRCPPRTVQIVDGRRNLRKPNLPKSISVRYTGNVKIDNRNSLQYQNGDDALVFRSNQLAAEEKIVNSAKTKLYMRKEDDEGLTGIEVDAYNQGTYKTELCNKWEETGACPYRGQCRFAHGASELRPVLRHHRYKTKVCRMVLSGMPCPYGHRCHFRHSIPPPQDI